jgi:hypothetical protein
MTTEDGRHQDGWRKSSCSSNGGNCVEIAVLSRDQVPAANKINIDRLLAMRDSKNPAGPRLYFTPTEWHAFARSVKAAAVDNRS